MIIYIWDTTLVSFCRTEADVAYKDQNVMLIRSGDAYQLLHSIGDGHYASIQPNEIVATFPTRSNPERPSSLRTALTNLVNAADDGEWHLSADCITEHRADSCPLCVALTAARFALDTTSGD